MKKIIFGIAFLMVLCAGIARADLIIPGQTPWWEGLDELSEEEKLRECQQIKRQHPDIENELDVLPTKKKWEMLGCRELLPQEEKQAEKQAEQQPAANPNAENSSSAVVNYSVPQVGASKISSRQYGLAGLVALLLSVVAFVLVWRTRKPNSPRIP